MSFIKEFLIFLKMRKKLWLIPLLVVFGILALLLFATQNPVVAPFIYTLF